MSSLNPRTTSAFEAASVGRDMSPGSSPPNSTSILPIQASIPILCPIPLDSNPPDSSRPYPHSSTSGVAPSRRRHHRIRGSSEEEKEEEEAILVRTLPESTNQRDTLVDYEHRGKEIRIDEDTLVVPPRSSATTAKASTIASYLANVLVGLAPMLNEDLANQNKLHQEVARQKGDLRLLSQHADQLTLNNNGLRKKWPH
ncbi:PKHD-type hydroxylase AB57_0577 [Striga asiatica]|uniref:PKHD-type hydroxylase AB57_0577 n=1 Tax=Striga asiatica TaxID=4170 RepID=A0A5A7Q6B9_STRAF|nr:PKHD-type hydroxylase AB57_0577 [Striga asiatica]